MRARSVAPGHCERRRELVIWVSRHRVYAFAGAKSKLLRSQQPQEPDSNTFVIRTSPNDSALTLFDELDDFGDLLGLRQFFLHRFDGLAPVVFGAVN